ncbi:MAG: glucose 1-dehydrogenase [Gaiellaceae bacterium]
MELNGKVAIVTGAGSGIGKAIAQTLADAGAAVCINYHGAYEQEAKAHAASIPRGIAVSADVSDPGDAAAMVATTVEQLGGLDILVNNAGIEHSSPLLDLDVADWDAVIAVNLRGAFCCLQAAARSMRDSGRGGSIINISSIHEDVAFPGYASYCASKGGLRMLMRNAAVELAPHKIRVNNIAPGAIVTPINARTLDDPAKVQTLRRIIPLGRMGKPEEVANAAAFLASDLASYITGSTYYVDGGMIRYAEPL